MYICNLYVLILNIRFIWKIKKKYSCWTLINIWWNWENTVTQYTHKFTKLSLQQKVFSMQDTHILLGVYEHFEIVHWAFVVHWAICCTLYILLCSVHSALYIVLCSCLFQIICRDTRQIHRTTINYLLLKIFLKVYRFEK